MKKPDWKKGFLALKTEALSPTAASGRGGPIGGFQIHKVRR